MADTQIPSIYAKVADSGLRRADSRSLPASEKKGASLDQIRGQIKRVFKRN